MRAYAKLVRGCRYEYRGFWIDTHKVSKFPFYDALIYSKSSDRPCVKIDGHGVDTPIESRDDALEKAVQEIDDILGDQK